MESLLKEIKDICIANKFFSLQRLIDSAENLLLNKFIDIAIFGQFKAGKSSFINSFIGKNILPTAVIPATSVITKIYFGEKEKAFIKFNDNRIEEIRLNEIDEYITESKNPNNIKGVSIANIEIPELKQYKGLCFVDTPGIGSIYLKNTQTTEDWSAEAAIVVICISAERPLSEFDLKLIRELNAYSYKQICLLTKTDFFTKNQLEEIISFMQNSFKREFRNELDIFYYSIFNNTELYKNIFYKKVCVPLIERYDKEIETIYQHKVLTIANHCLNYIEMAYKASLKTDEERKLLKEKIFDEKVNATFIQHELRLIASDSKSRVRDAIYKIFEPHTNQLINDLQNDFNNEFHSWKGNLYHLTEKFEEWLLVALRESLKKIAEKEKSRFDNMIDGINSHFNFYTKSLKARLSENIYLVLGIELSKEEWKPEFKPLKQPDISVYRVFDNHIELLWFLFPMFLFRNIFKKYFSKQISFEVEKNIYRITSDISEIINKETDYTKEETLKYILNELNSIENALLSEQSKSDELKNALNKLKQKIKNFI